MSNFSFKDDDDDLSALPSVDESLPAASPKPTPSKAVPPKATPPQKASVAKSVASPTAPSVPTPKAPLPKVPLPTTPKPTAPTPQVALPSVPVAKAPSPVAPTTPAAPLPASAARSVAPASGTAARPAPGAAPPRPSTPPGAATSGTPTARTAANTGGAAPARTPAPSPAAPPKVATPPAPTLPPTASSAARPVAARPTTGSTAPKAATSAAPLPALTDEGLSGELAHRQTKLSAKPQVKNVHQSALSRVLDTLTPVAVWLLRAAAVLGGLALLYIIYGVVSGALTQGGEDPRIISNIATAGGVLRWALLGAALGIFILMWDDRITGILTVILGLALYFGAVPLLGAVGRTTAIWTLANQLSIGGHALAALGLAKCVCDLAGWVIELPERMRVRADVGVAQQAEPRQQREAQNANMFSPCWKLPFCREVIRKQCPAFIAKTTCWKFGRGCYCDEEMISRIIRGESMDNVKAPTRMSRQGKPPCHRCYIFLEHQGLKYRIASPLAVPATIAIMYFGWPVYVGLTGKIGGSLQWLWDRLAFHGTTAVTDVTSKIADQAAKAPSTLSPEQVQHAAQTMFGVLIGFYVLIMISKGIEWAIYKARW